MTTTTIVDWTESLYSDTGDFIETISCSEMFTTQAQAEEFISTLDKSSCQDITLT